MASNHLTILLSENNSYINSIVGLRAVSVLMFWSLQESQGLWKKVLKRGEEAGWTRLAPLDLNSSKPCLQAPVDVYDDNYD